MGSFAAGRVHMAVPVSGMTPARRERNGNKHKRLFLGGPGALTVSTSLNMQLYTCPTPGLLLCNMLSDVAMHVVASCVVCDRAQSCCGFAQGADCQ